MNVTYIEWADSVYATGEWRTLDECLEWDRDVTFTVKQVGWILKEDKDSILIAGRKNEQGILEDIEEEYGLIQKIPKAWIIKRKELKV